MRDVNVGGGINAGRDVMIQDQSSQPKLLIHCTNEELLAEEKHRRVVLGKERARRRGVFIKVCLIAGALVLFAVAWAQFRGATDIVSLISGAAGVLLGMANLKAVERPSPFESRQLVALEEIHMILRERNARQNDA
jgi:hypothetical protein